MTLTIIALTGPPGAGKTTQESLICERMDAKRVVTTTDRPPRKGEVAGVHYEFLSAEEMAALEDDLVWRIPVHNNTYAVRRSAIYVAAADTGLTVISITPDKHETLRQAFQDEARVISIHLIGPDEEELRMRILQRGEINSADLDRRIVDARRFNEEALMVCGLRFVPDGTVEEVYSRIERIVEAA